MAVELPPPSRSPNQHDWEGSYSKEQMTQYAAKCMASATSILQSELARQTSENQRLSAELARMSSEQNGFDFREECDRRAHVIAGLHAELARLRAENERLRVSMQAVIEEHDSDRELSAADHRRYLSAAIEDMRVTLAQGKV